MKTATATLRFTARVIGVPRQTSPYLVVPCPGCNYVSDGLTTVALATDSFLPLRCRICADRNEPYGHVLIGARPPRPRVDRLKPLLSLLLDRFRAADSPDAIGAVMTAFRLGVRGPQVRPTPLEMMSLAADELVRHTLDVGGLVRHTTFAAERIREAAEALAELCGDDLNPAEVSALGLESCERCQSAITRESTPVALTAAGRAAVHAQLCGGCADELVVWLARQPAELATV